MYKDEVVLSTNFSEVELFKRGKVRDIYQIKDKLLIVATDRISAFDCILPDGIPYKGKILTGLSKFWFNATQDIISNHLISSEEENLPRVLFPFRKILKGRSMLVKKSEPVPIECVVRGYLAGSAYKEYKTHHSICGIALPRKLRLAERLPEPIFTPATKAEKGHDVNISKEKMKEMIGSELTEKLEGISLKIYKRASKFLERRGFILSDTKLEFGFHHGEVILIDELLTPDSSRFWSKKEYKPGSSPISSDKQFLRDYLSELDWDKTPPAPSLPAAIIEKTSEKYLEAYQKITGKKLSL